MSFHDVVLVLHNVLRWIVLAAGGLALARAMAAARSQRKWDDTDTKVLRAFVGAFDVQLLLGLVMYFGTSAFGVRAFAYGSEAMKNSVIRFFAIEHIFGMLVAAAVLHAGTARARRLGDAPARQRRTALIVGLALVIIFVSIPWPFYPSARPLLRLTA